jgi:hypothetical protein
VALVPSGDARRYTAPARWETLETRSIAPAVRFSSATIVGWFDDGKAVVPISIRQRIAVGASFAALTVTPAACGGGAGGKWPSTTSDVERQFVALCRQGEVRAGAQGTQLLGASQAVCRCMVRELRTRVSYSDFKDLTSASAGGVQVGGTEGQSVTESASACQRRFP